LIILSSTRSKTFVIFLYPQGKSANQSGKPLRKIFKEQRKTIFLESDRFCMEVFIQTLQLSAIF